MSVPTPITNRIGYMHRADLFYVVVGQLCYPVYPIFVEVKLRFAFKYKISVAKRNAYMRLNSLSH